MSIPDALYPKLCAQRGLPVPVPEYRFHPVRKWRFDWAFPDHKLAIEVQGGVWSRGKHGRGSGIVKDIEKAAHAAALGWRILPVVPSQLAADSTFELLRSALTYRTQEITP